MGTQPIPFSFDSHPVRVIVRDGSPWFVATDVCQALGLVNARDALLKLDDDEKATVGLADSQPGRGPQSLGIINESGLYTLVLRCRDAVKPGTVPHRFRKWVTSEVLPAIRKTGGYGRQLDLLDHEAIQAARKAYTNWGWEAHKRMRDAGIEFPSMPPGVEQAALEAALADAMMTARFMLTFDDDYRMQVKPVPRDCMVMTLDGVAKYLADPGAMPCREAVSAIAQAAVGRLARM